MLLVPPALRVLTSNGFDDVTGAAAQDLSSFRIGDSWNIPTILTVVGLRVELRHVKSLRCRRCRRTQSPTILPGSTIGWTVPSGSGLANLQHNNSRQTRLGST